MQYFVLQRRKCSLMRALQILQHFCCNETPLLYRALMRLDVWKKQLNSFSNSNCAAQQ